MFLLDESANPFDYMGSIWTIFVVIIVITGILFVIGKPLHRYFTDRKTSRIIDEAGVKDVPAAPPAAGGAEGGAEGKEASGGKGEEG